MARALLIVDHGSRRAEANSQLSEQARLIAAKRKNLLVGFAHMELADPDIDYAVDALAAQGATDITVVPFMLTPGRHATEDIPRLAGRAMERHPQIQWRVTEPLGVHDFLADLVLVRSGLAEDL